MARLTYVRPNELELANNMLSFVKRSFLLCFIAFRTCNWVPLSATFVYIVFQNWRLFIAELLKHGIVVDFDISAITKRTPMAFTFPPLTNTRISVAFSKI